MMWFLLIWSLNSMAFFALASSMSKHQKQMFNRELAPTQTRLASIVGWVMLLISFIACICTMQISNGMSYWVGTLSFAALFVGLTLSYFAHKAKLLAILSAVLAVICFILTLI